MPIQLTCPSCGVPVQAPDDAVGKVGMCPKCRQRFTIGQPGPGGAGAPPAPRAPEYGTAPPGPVQGYVVPGVYGPAGLPVPPQMSRMAIASLVLGLLCFTSPIGLILGIAALVRINRSPGRLGGQGLAIAGVCVSSSFLFLSLFFLPVIAAIASPNLLRSRMAANEYTAINSLKTVATQEAVFRQQAEVDQNGNGTGEYGLLGELAGEIALRPSSRQPANPAYISQRFRTGGNQGNGTALKIGYRYRLCLSNATSHDMNAAGDDRTLGGSGATGGPMTDEAAVALQEASFAIYAWPEEIRSTGARAFFVNEVGEVYATKMEARTYDGTAAMPAANAAYVAGGAVFRGRISSGITRGNDGNQWFPCGG